MSLGDRCKKNERIETEQRFIPGVPLYIRIDGRGFSKFTKGMKRPFDADMSKLMQDTTKALMDEFNCCTGYTQSDEISLVINGNVDFPFDGKKQKLVSSMAAFASSYFAIEAMKYFPDRVQKRAPTFDCRIVSATKNDVVENFIFRVRDCIKNSSTMAASAYFSHKQLQGVQSKQKIEMLKLAGVDFYDFPLYFREGTFFKKALIEKEIPDDIWDKIPDDNKPDSRIVIRSEIQDCEIQDFESMPDKQKFIFNKYIKDIE